MRPEYGFFHDYPLSVAYLAVYDGDEGRPYRALRIGVLPDLAKRFLAAHNADARDIVTLTARLEDHQLVLRPGLSRTALRPRRFGNTVTAYEASYTERGHVGVDLLPRLKTFRRHPVEGVVQGGELRLTVPRRLLANLSPEGLAALPLSPLREATEMAVRSLPLLLRPGGPSDVTVEAPTARTLLLEGEGGEIVTYTLPKRVAEAVATLAAPYRS